MTTTPQRRLRTLIIQVVMFCIGLGLLALCIRTAMQPKFEPQIERLRNAPIEMVLALIGLSLTTLFLNACTFWTAIYPVKRVPFWDIQATNAGAALANYAPAKLGAILRFVVHNRRNHVPIFTIGAWIGAVSVTMMCALFPVVAAGMWRKAFDLWFLAALLAGLAFTYGTTLLLARAFAHERGLARLHAITARFNSRLLDRVMHSGAFRNLHAGLTMLAHPWSFAAGVVLRVVDLLVQALRFMVAAHLLGLDLTFEWALISSGAYFLVTVFSPAGPLGLREWVVTWLATLGLTEGTMQVMALTVTLSEIAVYVVCGSLGLLYVRPDRFLERHAQPQQVPQPAAESPPTTT